LSRGDQKGAEMPELGTKLAERAEAGHVFGFSRHGFRSAAEVALAHYEEQHGVPDEALQVEFFITAENPVHDYIAVLVPPGS
jgi:hypothetical protein